MPTLPLSAPRLLKLAFWISTLAVATLSLLPVAFLPPQSFNVWDKAQHAGGFAVLALLGHAAYRHHLWRLCIGLLAYGAAIELAQSATGWRYGDGMDLLADGIGIALGTVAVLLARGMGSAVHRQ